MEVSILELAKQCPDVTISVKSSDLRDAFTSFKDELLQELRDAVPIPCSSPEESFLSREETMETLRVSSATLWRWKKSGFLVPVPMGSMDRYRQSDIDKIMKQRGGTL